MSNISGSLFNVSGNDSHYNMSLPLDCNANMPIITLLTQILYSIICVVGLLGNTLVIYVVIRFSKMQTVTNIYILNLALADECFLIGIPFLVTTMSFRVWNFGKIMCKVYMTTTSINQFTSSIFLLIMSCDRYIAICHPIFSPKIRTPFIAKIVSGIAWTTSIGFMVPILLHANVSESDTGQKSCNIYWPDEEGGQKYFTYYSFLFSFAAPFTLISVFYFLVTRKLRTVGPKNKSKEKKKSHRKVTKLVLTVIAVFFICWSPYWFTQISLIYTTPNQCQSRVNITVFLVAGIFSYSNSAVNPILYAFLSDNFKKSFKKACTCASGKDINATLHIENSVFPRKNKANTEPTQTNKQVTTGNAKNDGEDEENERGLLISKTSTTTVTMTSRSNITVTSEVRDPSSQQKEKDSTKNGTQLTLLTQV